MMTALVLDHFTICTDALEDTRAFFEDVIGLAVGKRPGFKFPGYWLYLGEKPVVHLFARDAAGELSRYMGERHAAATGPVGPTAFDHIAFRCRDLPAFEAKLKARGTPYRRRTVPEISEHQLFISDPNGVPIELIFPATEQASWVTDEAGVEIESWPSTELGSSTAMHPIARLRALGHELPAAPKAVGAYLPWQRMGSTVMTSFQLPWRDGTLAWVGRLGEQLSVEQGIAAARVCVLNGLAQLHDAAADLSRVRVVRVDGHVGCVEGFAEISKVLDGASTLINEVMGERGRHARTSLAHTTMPLNVPVMLGFWAEIDAS